MNSIHFAKNIANLRREKGNTQADVAAHMGVTVASVSKWETGQSYPDVTLLPLLATFFDTSIDDLLGYTPQMKKEDIAKLYRELGEEVATTPYTQVLEKCREITRQYYSCYPLLFQMGMFLLNTCSSAPTPEEQAEAIEFAKQLFQRVQQESTDTDVCHQALLMEAYCNLANNEADQVLVLLEHIAGRQLVPAEPIVAAAYGIKGENEKAMETLQSGLYQIMTIQFSYFNNYLHLCMMDEARFEATAQRALAIAAAYELEQLHPSLLLSLYVAMAIGYLAQKKNEKALDVLEQYVSVLEGDIYPLRLHGDFFFDKIDSWLDGLALQGQVPRSEALVKKDLLDFIDNPALSPLHGDDRFIAIKKRLDKLKE